MVVCTSQAECTGTVVMNARHFQAAGLTITRFYTQHRRHTENHRHASRTRWKQSLNHRVPAFICAQAFDQETRRGEERRAETCAVSKSPSAAYFYAL